MDWQPMDWQPMETAPRDGTVVLVRFTINEGLSNGQRVVTNGILEARFDPASWNWLSVPHGHRLRPEQWRPVPRPPTPPPGLR